MRRPLILTLLAAVGVVAITASTSAHFKTGDPDSPDSEWYFFGSSYKKGTDERKDPVNFMFYDAGDGSDYTRDRIETHMSDDWNFHRVGGRRWKTDGETNFWCKPGQRMYWTVPPDSQVSDLTDWHGSTARFAGYCGNQHHARFWDDYEHSRRTSRGRRHQWVVGGIHHERVKYKAFIIPAGHVIDRDWDIVRREMVRAMGVHCADAAWRYHPGADDLYQKYTNSGFIARISLAHKASGC
jgi:hypothetical protein